MAAAKACAAMAADGVDLVDKDDAGSVLFALHEQIADARGADTDEHLDEIRTGDREERDACFTGDRTREQCLAGTRSADQQDALGNTSAEARETLRILEELNYLFE